MGLLADSRFTIVLLVFGVYIAYEFRRRRLRKANLIETGCSPLPRYPHKDPILLDLFINMVKSIQNGDTIGPDMERFRKLGKTYEANSWGSKMISTMDSANMQTMFTSAFDNFSLAILRYGPSVPLLGSGIFTTDGAEWEHSRNLVKPIFARARISDLSAFEVHVNRMIESIPKDGSTVDLQHFFKLLVSLYPGRSIQGRLQNVDVSLQFLDSSTEFLFGEFAESLLGKDIDSDVHRLRLGFDNAMRGIHSRWFLGKFRFLLGTQRKYWKTCLEVHSIVDKYIDRAFERKASRSSTSEKESPQKCVLLDELVEMGADRIDIRDQCLGVFFPARDTTALGVSNVFFFLARHPDVWRKLRAEVLSIDQPLTFEYLKSLKCLRYVINESRLPCRNRPRSPPHILETC